VIDGLNADPDVHGILVQLPLPEHLPYKAVLERIHPRQGRGRLPPAQRGPRLRRRSARLRARHAGGIMEMLRREQVPTHGRHVVIVGRSLIVSKPLASLLMAPGPTPR
jgi:methylenetetrahydrofolate dehydrogenase (NADP+) / methenyltetrahydrofolate cyclohydrolase